MDSKELEGSKDTFVKLNEKEEVDFRERWRKRTFSDDWRVQWLNGFVDYHQDKSEVLPEDLVYIHDDERAQEIYKKWCVSLRK